MLLLYYSLDRRDISPAPLLTLPLYDAALAGYLLLAIVIPSAYMVVGLVIVGRSTHESLVSLAASFLPGIVVMFLAITLGEVVRGRRALAAETAERLRLAGEEREAEAARRVAEERLRIARDLHDTVAHSMATIAVQAGSALHLLDGGDARLRAALTAIRQTSKEALGEMRATLGQLRQGDHSAGPRVRAGGLDRLPALCEAVTAAGAAVTVEVSGKRRPLPPAVDQAAYRIVQESLTNVLRHAGDGAGALVRLGFEPSALTIGIRDDGGSVQAQHTAPPPRAPATHSPPAQPTGEGHGLAGMTERIAELGGHLTAGPCIPRGFEVSVWLPLAPAGQRQ